MYIKLPHSQKQEVPALWASGLGKDYLGTSVAYTGIRHTKLGTDQSSGLRDSLRTHTVISGILHLEAGTSTCRLDGDVLSWLIKCHGCDYNYSWADVHVSVAGSLLPFLCPS